MYHFAYAFAYSVTKTLKPKVIAITSITQVGANPYILPVFQVIWNLFSVNLIWKNFNLTNRIWLKNK